MPDTVVNNMTLTANNIAGEIVHTGEDIFSTLSNTLNAAGDYVVFGSNDRRHGAMGLIMGPIYDALWQNLSVVISTMLGMTIGDYCNFNDRMYGYMTRLMLINLWEHNTTLSMLCEGGSNQASGNSQTITHEAFIPPYTLGNNYLEDARDIIRNEKVGVDTTSMDLTDPGSPYKKVRNLFPDENNQRAGEFTNGDVWEVSNPNSILYKTKCLFEQRKINSLISRFGSEADANPDPNKLTAEGNARTGYGLSHGRNLLTKRAEDGNNDYAVNGYNNPYCRVWTHHYQYDKFNKTMRPFKNGMEGPGDAHNWGGKFNPDEIGKDNKIINKFGWKQDARWNKTVLEGRGDGLINITPHFSGGGKSNIHSKDCMFSIENLAWKDYDPYSFETALSWEQRGPLGGRIMWFPPYGLSFNETSQAQWNSNTFIGRGEDVYTYVNTKRTGVLQFYLVVDHPSVLDYVTWYEANRDNVKDTDILRYFAGCDPNDRNNPDSLLHYVQPTPLTDEGERGKESDEFRTAVRIKPKETVPAKVEEIEFVTYFPNNYSGMFDAKDENKHTGIDFVIKYLLSGKNAQETYTINGNTPVAHPIVDEFTGHGYEIEWPNGITDENEGGPSIEGKNKYAIIGNKTSWPKGGSTRGYDPDSTKLWKYRIDGTYDVPKTDNTGQLNNIYSNTYAQTLGTNESYKDSIGYYLNLKLENQGKAYNDNIPENAYTFVEVVKALAELKEKNDILELFNGRTLFNTEAEQKEFDERVKYLKELFSAGDSGIKLTEMTFYGYANSQGINANSSINQTRNEILAKERANTVEALIKSLNESWKNITPNRGNDEVKKVSTGDENSLEAKVYRSTRCRLTFRMDETVDATDADEPDGDLYQGFYKAQGESFGGKDVYRLAKDDGSRWVLVGADKDGNGGRLYRIPDNETEIKDYADECFWLEIMNRDQNKDGIYYDNEIKDTVRFAGNDWLFNKVRYDQEYHFFRRVKEETPLIYEKLMDKLKIFDPGYHSMTPEGFNARCTFLNQCTRQGNTVGVSDRNRLSASNMAFGRPPFCVLRIGDFYNQQIIIDSVNIQYDTSGGIVWDLNDEGAGVQPMLAQVSINFTFIGGGSLDGPVRKLQNSMSFSFYSNTELYDNRADRVTYDYDRTLTMGGAGKGDISIKDSSFHSVEMYNPENLHIN